MKRIEESVLRRFIAKNVVENNLFAEEFSLADKLLLRDVAIEQAEDFMKSNAPIAHFSYILAVVKEMKRRYGYEPADRFKEDIQG